MSTEDLPKVEVPKVSVGNNVSVTVELNTGEMKKFVFKKMGVDEASGWASRMKSRVVYYESLQKLVEEYPGKPIQEQDTDEFEKLTDDEASMLKKIMVLAKDLSRYAINPSEEEMRSMVECDIEGMLTVYMKYLASLFPTEADSKNLSGDSKQVNEPSSGFPAEPVKSTL